MSFATKHQRTPGNYLTKKYAYKVFGPDCIYRLKDIKFKSDKFTTKEEELPYLIIDIDETFSYEADDDTLRTCEPGEYQIKTSPDMVDDCTDIISDPDSMADIAAGIVGFKIYKYVNTNLNNKICYGIQWVDIDSDGNEVSPIE